MKVLIRLKRWEKIKNKYQSRSLLFVALPFYDNCIVSLYHYNIQKPQDQHLQSGGPTTYTLYMYMYMYVYIYIHIYNFYQLHHLLTTPAFGGNLQKDGYIMSNYCIKFQLLTDDC